MTRIAEIYAERDANDIKDHCETLVRVAEKRQQNMADKEPMMSRISSALESISSSVENANFGSYSEDGKKMWDIIKAVADTIKTIEGDEDLTAMFYDSIMKMSMWGGKGRPRPGRRPNIYGPDWDDDYDDDDDDYDDDYDDDDGDYGDEDDDYYGMVLLWEKMTPRPAGLWI